VITPEEIKVWRDAYESATPANAFERSSFLFIARAAMPRLLDFVERVNQLDLDGLVNRIVALERVANLAALVECDSVELLEQLRGALSAAGYEVKP
jgi:hypothetical protein